MSTTTKLGAFLAGLAMVLAAAFGVGRLVGPLGQASAADESHHASSATEQGAHGGHPGATGRAEGEAPGGLQVSERGYTLALDQETRSPGPTSLAFRILGPDGKPVTAYQREHDKDLHLIVVRRDLSGFQHVHPRLDDTGRWTTEVRLTAGTWRVFADFKPKGGVALTLGADLTVPGSQRPEPLPAPARTASVDGYRVTLTGGLTPAKGTRLTLTIRKDGRPVTDLQPYLGAYGHLVALRAGDLGYLHVHPDGEPGDGTTAPGPQVAFHATAPSRGSYRLYLDFKHDGVVRTAEFTVRTEGAPSQAAPASTPSASAHDHSH